MVSKTAKRRNKRGRPRAAGKHREENGRVTRAKNLDNTAYPPGDVISAQVARLRSIGWDKMPERIQIIAMTDPRTSTYIGRCNLLGENWGTAPNAPKNMVSKEQYQAAQRYLEIRNQYHKAIGAPDAHYEGGGIEISEDEKAEQVTKAKARWNDLQRVIQEANIVHHGSNLFAAVQVIVVEDQQMPHLVGDLRLALNALDRHFKGVK